MDIQKGQRVVLSEKGRNYLFKEGSYFIGRIPKSIAEEILGFKIMSKDVIIDDVLLSPDIERGK